MNKVYGERVDQAILPEFLEEKTIADMEIGEGAYVVAWAMYVDEERRCWLLGGMTPSTEPCGTVDTWIERHEEGWQVWVNGRNHWKPGSRGVITSYEKLLPVAKLHVGARLENGRS